MIVQKRRLLISMRCDGTIKIAWKWAGAIGKNSFTLGCQQLHRVEDDAALPAQVRAVAKLELQVLQSDSSMSVGMGLCN